MAARRIADTQEAEQSPAFPIVIVSWHDHATVNKTGVSWPKIEDIRKEAENPYACLSVGYLIHETDDYVLLSQTVGDDATCSENIKILKSCIDDLKTVVIKKAKVKK